jgi:hypothetical protein
MSNTRRGPPALAVSAEVADQNETEVALELIPAPAIQKRILFVRERQIHPSRKDGMNRGLPRSARNTRAN